MPDASDSQCGKELVRVHDESILSKRATENVATPGESNDTEADVGYTARPACISKAT